MAVGIEKIKEALASLSEMVDTGAEIMKDGIGASDVFQLPDLISQAYSLASSLKASLESGELQDVDLAEAKELLGVAIGLIVKVVEKIKK